MFVKIIRGNAQVTEIYEPNSIEFRIVNELDYEDEKDKPMEELFLKHTNGFNQAILLYSKDKVWLTSDSGKTVDRWTIQ
ncbi:MAG: hypothetical protein JRJ62_14820 [Deltaproteobacteria bacterium]|nr:hypothetical protein [Deltaproteobacteria bacterium]